MRFFVYPGNHTLVELSGLQNLLTGAYVNSATADMTVVDVNSAQVPGITWPASFTPVQSSNGDYSATLSNSAGWIVGQWYFGKITVVTTEGLRGNWEIEMEAQKRT